MKLFKLFLLSTLSLPLSLNSMGYLSPKEEVAIMKSQWPAEFFERIVQIAQEQRMRCDNIDETLIRSGHIKEIDGQLYIKKRLLGIHLCSEGYSSQKKKKKCCTIL